MNTSPRVHPRMTAGHAIALSLLALGLAGLSATAAEPTGHGQHGQPMQHGQHGGPGAHRAFDDPAAYAKSWEDPARDAWQKPAALVQALGVVPGMAVADIGTGTGYLLPHLSRAAGPQGKVHAVDVSPQMLRWVAERAQREGLANVTTVTAQGGSTGLGAASIDRAIMVNVWHHVADQGSYVADLHRVLRPGGVVFIVEAKPEFRDEAGPPAHFRLPAEQVAAQLRQAGFRTRVDTALIDRQYVVRGER